jgi:homoserine O-acetyltransferase/O-succinyltransferase
MRTTVLVLLLATCNLAAAGGVPKATEGHAVLKDFKFASGQTLPELKMHYRTLGKAVFILHGTAADRILP